MLSLLYFNVTNREISITVLRSRPRFEMHRDRKCSYKSRSGRPFLSLPGSAGMNAITGPGGASSRDPRVPHRNNDTRRNALMPAIMRGNTYSPGKPNSRGKYSPPPVSNLHEINCEERGGNKLRGGGWGDHSKGRP